MFHLRWVLGGFLLASLATSPVAGQSRALVLFGQGGRLVPVIDLSSDGDAISSGTSLGAGIALQFGERSALRGSFVIVESDYEGPSQNLSDRGVTRTFMGLDLMFGLPTDIGLAPYVFFGGGRVAVNPADPSIEGFAKIAGRVGSGVNLVPTNSLFAIFLEFGGWLYEFDRMDFDRVQLDLALTGGVALAVPY